jgi:hypothetical protein
MAMKGEGFEVKRGDHARWLKVVVLLEVEKKRGKVRQ